MQNNMVCFFETRYIESIFIVTLMIFGLLAAKKILKNHISAEGQYKMGYLLFIILLLPFCLTECLDLKRPTYLISG